MKIALLSLLLLATASLGFPWALEKYYGRYEGMEKHIETSLSYDASTANAIKHAKAASDMYRLFNVVLTDNMAEEAVIRLGVLNEYIERFKFPKEQRDSAREIMKDLHNNYAGILAARAADRADAFRIILAFADNRTLIVKDVYNPFFEGKEPRKHVVAFGYNWFDAHRAEIDSRIERKLARVKDQMQAASVEVSELPANRI